MIKSSKLCDLHIPNQSMVVKKERAGISLQAVQNFNFSLTGSNSTATSISPGKLSSPKKKKKARVTCAHVIELLQLLNQGDAVQTVHRAAPCMVLPRSQIIPRNCFEVPPDCLGQKCGQEPF